MAFATASSWVRPLRVDRAGADQLDELRDVSAVVAVAQLDRQVLVHRHADREGLRGRRVDADDRRASRLGERLDRPAQRHATARRRDASCAVVALRARSRRARLANCLARTSRCGPPRAGLLGVHADGVDGAIDPDASGQLADRVDRVLGVEVDDLGALRGAPSRAGRSMLSTPITRPAPMSCALTIANRPTGPQPKTATVSPGRPRRARRRTSRSGRCRRAGSPARR